MQLNPYLNFNGRCEAAFKFYEKSLGGKIEMMLTHAGSPMEGQLPPEWRDKIMHARLVVGGQVLMGSDAPPDHYKEAKGFAVSFTVDTPADAERVFNALAANGTVQMPMQQTFFSARFGMLVDQFGVPWMINCEQAA
jgi:PhnB protein